MNHKKEVAKMLGVELGEEFEIKGAESDNPFKLCNTGLFNREEFRSPGMLNELLNGNYEIVKKPWVPKDGENVWAVHADGSVGDTCFMSCCYGDLSRFALGCLCRTREEAEAHADEIQEQMRRILVGELRAELVEVRK